MSGVIVWGDVEPMFEKKRTHEAMSDIRESIAELRYLREEVYR